MESKLKIEVVFVLTVDVLNFNEPIMSYEFSSDEYPSEENIILCMEMVKGKHGLPVRAKVDKIYQEVF